MVGTGKQTLPGLGSNWKPSFGQQIYDGKIAEAKAVIEADRSAATKPDESGRSAIHWACSAGQRDFVEYLTSLGVPVDEPDQSGWTPLLISAAAGNEDLVRYLLSKGVRIDQANSTGQQAIHYAASKNNLPVLELLLELGASLNAKDSSGSTPLHRAASQGHSRICEFLVKNGAAVNSCDNFGNTPLYQTQLLLLTSETLYVKLAARHVSCEAGHPDIARFFAEHGASVAYKNKDEKTPLDFCDKQLSNLLTRLARG